MVNTETSKNDEMDDDVLSKETLHRIESRISEKIIKSNYGVMITDDPTIDGYYIVEWS